ncbi:hypothetical protein BLNAU_11304 [Blattamonas nauphoetae]|uniref:Uncharacterized protein n=1 Tax=Blattamonas nauphoetae TaxID=2049346 RepID=A0ABQ9XQQ2_9EUKA|nr:hypothetical protein BLNAU_11304 [Blattamonas nauphoetae]
MPDENEKEKTGHTKNFSAYLLPQWKQWRFIPCLPFEIVVRCLLAICSALIICLPMWSSNYGTNSQRFALGSYYSLGAFEVDEDPEIHLWNREDMIEQYKYVIDRALTESSTHIVVISGIGTLYGEHEYFEIEGGKRVTNTFTWNTSSIEDPARYGFLGDFEEEEQLALLKKTNSITIRTIAETKMMDYWSHDSLYTWNCQFVFEREHSGHFTLKPTFSHIIMRANPNIWLLFFVIGVGLICALLSMIIALRSLFASCSIYSDAKKLAKEANPPLNWKRVPFQSKRRFFTKWDFAMALTAILHVVDFVFAILRETRVMTHGFWTQLLDGLCACLSWVCLTRYLQFTRRESQLFLAMRFSAPFLFAYVVTLVPIVIGIMLFSVSLYASDNEHFTNYWRVFNQIVAFIFGDELYPLYVRLNGRNPFITIVYIVFVTSIFLFFMINVIRSIVERGYTSANFSLYSSNALYVGNREFDYIDNFRKKVKRQARKKIVDKQHRTKHKPKHDEEQSTSSLSTSDIDSSALIFDATSSSSVGLSSDSSLSFSSSSNAFNEHERMADMMDAYNARQGVADKQKKMMKIFQDTKQKQKERKQKKQDRRRQYENTLDSQNEEVRNRFPDTSVGLAQRYSVNTGEDNLLLPKDQISKYRTFRPVRPKTDAKREVPMDYLKQEIKQFDRLVKPPSTFMIRSPSLSEGSSVDGSLGSQQTADIEEQRLDAWAKRAEKKFGKNLNTVQHINEDVLNWNSEDEKLWRKKQGIKMVEAYQTKQTNKQDEEGNAKSDGDQRALMTQLGDIMEFTTQKTSEVGKLEEQIGARLDETHRQHRLKTKRGNDESSSDSTTDIEKRRLREQHVARREERRIRHEQVRQARFLEQKKIREQQSGVVDDAADASLMNEVEAQLRREEKEERAKAARLLPSFLFSAGKNATVLHDHIPQSLDSSSSSSSSDLAKHRVRPRSDLTRKHHTQKHSSSSKSTDKPPKQTSPSLARQSMFTPPNIPSDTIDEDESPPHKPPPRPRQNNVELVTDNPDEDLVVSSSGAQHPSPSPIPPNPNFNYIPPVPSLSAAHPRQKVQTRDRFEPQVIRKKEEQQRQTRLLLEEFSRQDSLFKQTVSEMVAKWKADMIGIVLEHATLVQTEPVIGEDDQFPSETPQDGYHHEAPQISFLYQSSPFPG